jgi:hypothetical protein
MTGAQLVIKLRAAVVARLKLEAALARCENELYAAQREIAQLKQTAQKKAKKTTRKRHERAGATKRNT